MTTFQAYRFACNWGQDLVGARLEQRCRLRGQALIEGLDEREAATLAVPWDLAGLRREWDRATHQVAPWWAGSSKEAYSSGLALAWRRRRGRARQSCRSTTGALGVIDAGHVRVPRVGPVKPCEPTVKLLRRLGGGSARRCRPRC